MLLYGADKDICEWVSLNMFGEPDAFGETSKATGIVKDGELIAGIIYNNYQPKISIEMSIFSLDKRWCSRHNLKYLFKYPFIDLRVKRVTTLCSATEGDIIMFNERLGFKKEGLHREAWHSGGDAISWGMLKNECKWLSV
jgi:RimJ/RimL family protein N-acetyltransferase